MCVWTYILDKQQSKPSEAHYYVKKENKNRFSLNCDLENNNSNETIYFVHVKENSNELLHK